MKSGYTEKAMWLLVWPLKLKLPLSLYHLCKLLTLLVFYFIYQLNILNLYYLNCVIGIYTTI